MELKYRHSYDGTTDQVAQLLLNEEFVTDVATHAGATRHEVSVEGNVARLRMAIPSPSELRRVAEAVEMSQTFTVGEKDAQGVRSVQVDVKVDKLPVQVDAGGVLRPLGDAQCEAHYTGELRVRVPLIGKTIEKQAKPFIDRAFDGIHRRAQAWLARCN